ncbi:MAG: hypothetical protein JXL97_12455 [Bacteroidales bacterium]|nr:hypothetical protein [Bacteroidales bacterium]
MKQIFIIFCIFLVVLATINVSARPGGGNSYNSDNNSEYSSGDSNNWNVPGSGGKWNGFTKGLTASLLLILSITMNAASFPLEKSTKTTIKFIIIYFVGLLLPLIGISWIWFSIYYLLNILITFALFKKSNNQ